jgi:hypothetical protein
MMKYLISSVYYPLNLPYSSRRTYHLELMAFLRPNICKMDTATEPISSQFFTSEKLVPSG